MDDLAGQRDRADLFRRQALRKWKERSQKFAPKDHRWPSRS